MSVQQSTPTTDDPLAPVLNDALPVHEATWKWGDDVDGRDPADLLAAALERLGDDPERVRKDTDEDGNTVFNSVWDITPDHATVPEAVRAYRQRENTQRTARQRREVVATAVRIDRELRDDVHVLAERETGTLYAYHDGVWRDDGEQVVGEHAEGLLGSTCSSEVVTELCEQVRRSAAVERQSLGVNPWGIAVENGLLDLREREIRELHPDDHALWKLSVEYDPDAECPRFKEFLGNVCRAEDIPKVQEYVGYMLQHWTAERKKALMLFGPTNSGKSVFCDVLTALFGTENVASVSPQYLADERWGVAQLDGKPVNIRHDLDPSVIQQPGPLKEAISGDMMMAERKGEDPYPVEPTAKHLWAANQSPSINEEDDALLDRMLIAEFPRTIPRNERVSRDQLEAELTAELPGILNWALDGLHRLLEQGGFTNARHPGQIADKWREYGDSIERFIEECVVQEDGEVAPKDEVYGVYARFARDHGLSQESKSKVTRELKAEDGISDSQRRVNGERIRVYTGMRLDAEEYRRDRDDDASESGNSGSDTRATGLGDYNSEGSNG